MVANYEVGFKSQGRIDVINIQKEMEHCLVKSGIQNGLITAFVPGSTAGLSTVEYEPGLVRDIKDFFGELIPYGKAYAHHNTWHDDNGSSHLQATLMGPSLAIPVVDGHMTLGTWQQPILVDFDTRPRTRRLVVQVVGE